MKINLSSAKAELTALTESHNLKSPVSGTNKANILVENADLKRSELLSRSIESLLKMMKPTDKTHELLKGIINLIPRLPIGLDGLPANTNDSKLLLQLLKQFRISRKDLLPEKIIKELKFAEKLIEQNQLNQQKEDPVILLPEIRTLGRPAIQINEEGIIPDSEEDVNKLNLLFNLEILGSLSVELSREGEKQNCSIQCTKKESRNKIKKVHTKLLNQIKKRELRLDILRIQYRSASSKTVKVFKAHKKKGFSLWG